MRIGMITTSVPHAGDPVAGRFVVEMAEALGAQGHDVRVLAVRRRDRARWDAPQPARGFTLRVIDAPGAGLLYDGGAPERLRGLGGWSRALGVGASLGAVAARWLRDRDALVSHFLLPSAVVAGAIRGGRPHLAIAHGSDGALVARLPGAVRAAVLRGATARWYSHAALRDRVHAGDRDAIVRPMGFHGGVTRRPSRDAVRALVVSRLVPVKAVARAVEAVARARAMGAHVTLDVLGDGPDRAALQRLVTTSLGPHGRLHGAVDPRTRDAFLAGADLFLHTPRALPDGRTEGAPVSVIEAMGAGLCVVATDAGGVAELLGGAGVLLPERASSDEIGAAVAALARDPERRITLGDKAMARAAPWRWDETARLVAALLAR